MEFLQVLLLVVRPLLYPRRNEIEMDDEEDASHFEAELTREKLTAASRRHVVWEDRAFQQLTNGETIVLGSAGRIKSCKSHERPLSESTLALLSLARISFTFRERSSLFNLP
jgi:hypothetical protein